MRKFFLALALLPSLAIAQFEGSSFTSTGRGGATTFATDYQCLGINPANLGWHSKFSDKKFALGFNEMTYSVFSEALSKTDLRNSIKELIKGNGKDFTYDEKIAAAESFAKTGLALNVDYGSFGFGYGDDKFGGIAFRINDRFQWYSKFGDKASELLFLGKTASYFDSLHVLLANGDTATYANTAANLATLDRDSILNGFASLPKKMSEILDGSDISLSWTREWNVSYGRKLFGDSTFAMYLGVGMKYYQGIGMLNIKSENGKMEAFSSLSPAFQIDYKTQAAEATNQIKSDKFFPPKPVGQGFGFDFGLNVVIKNKVKIGAALINMGSIKWTGNVYTVKDSALSLSNANGLNNFNVYSQLGDIMGKNGLLNLVGQKDTTIKLPGMMRGGISFMLGKKVELGFDALIPFNEVPGSYKQGIFGFGGDITPVKWVKFSVGFVTGGNTNFEKLDKSNVKVPIGITFNGGDGSYEIGIASRDAITFFTQNGPTLSLSMGFMRFRF
ncbi:MAG TPA: DUF5723 family protein [Flavobacteriales bacterium]|nr:DUF5723 family protein [Flavobacteriales bacterium]